VGAPLASRCSGKLDHRDAPTTAVARRGGEYRADTAIYLFIAIKG